tara:strand:- start:74 stop:391 length:318 start_codon:yes stop_codon:yes gene_type:complete
MNINYPKCLFDLNNDILEIIEKNIRYKKNYNEFVKRFQHDLWRFTPLNWLIDEWNKSRDPKYFYIINHIWFSNKIQCYNDHNCHENYRLESKVNCKLQNPEKFWN